jgi:hypothetical protein
MEAWREEALTEIKGLKPYWTAKHDWHPQHVASDETIDLYVRLQSRRLEGRVFLLRLRYLSDWQAAGRRETFVNPKECTQEGIEFWPPHDTVRGVLPQHQPPAICLKGVWGYHSVLHKSERPDGTTLLGFLLELQGVLDE